MTADRTADPIRVLIADDSKTARATLADLCARDGAMQVVAHAADGAEAVDLAVQLRPTIILMDITMPSVDGYEATRQIMTQAPTRIVMVTAAADPRSVNVTLRALEAGALTVLAKPDLADGGASAAQFVSRVKLLSEVGVIRRHAVRKPPVRPRRVRVPRSGCSAGIVAVATSTGGPQALHELLKGLPADFPLPIVVVQHIVEGFVPGLATWLDAKLRFDVKVAVDGERLRGGTVYLAPDRQHLTVAQRCVISLDSSHPIGGFRPSGTALLVSVAKVCGADAIAVVLTGMGSDGLDGARAVSNAGGTVLAQDQHSSIVFGMPGAVIAAGLADVVGPVDSLARRIGYLAARRSV